MNLPRITTLNIPTDIEPVSRTLYAKALEVSGALQGIVETIEDCRARKEPISFDMKLTLSRERSKLLRLIDDLRAFKNKTLRPLRDVQAECETAYDGKLARLSIANAWAGEVEDHLSQRSGVNQ